SPHYYFLSKATVLLLSDFQPAYVLQYFADRPKHRGVHIFLHPLVRPDVAMYCQKPCTAVSICRSPLPQHVIVSRKNDRHFCSTKDVNPLGNTEWHILHRIRWSESDSQE